MLFHDQTDQLVMGTYGPPPFRLSVRLPVAALTTHLRVAGVSGMGKSRYLAHLFLSLIRQGYAATLLDPHADTARLILGHLVAGGFYTDPTAFERVAYWDLPGAAAVGRYLPLNVLEQPFDAPTVARLVLEALRRAWPGLEGGVAPAFENAVLAGVSVLVRHKLPLPLLHDVLTDDAWRRQLLQSVTDPATRGFFARLDAWSSRERAQYLGSTLRRSFLLNFSPVLRLSLGQGDNAIRMGERMAAGQSAIVNLALPDPDARRLLGSLLTVLVEQAALQRLATPAGERGPLHFLFVDEWSQFASQSGTAITTILEQTRKAGVGLVLASQTEGQLSERVRAAAQNAGTSAIFRLGRADAELVAPALDHPDPYAVKHEVRDKQIRKRMHPVYTNLAEQREAWVGQIQRLPPRRFFLRQPNGRVARLDAPPLHDAVVDAARLAWVEERYLTAQFWPGAVMEEELRRLRPAVAPSGAGTRRRGRAPDTGDCDGFGPLLPRAARGRDGGDGHPTPEID